MAEGDRLRLSPAQVGQLVALLNRDGARTLDLDTIHGTIRIEVAPAASTECVAGPGEAIVIIPARTVGEFLTTHPRRSTPPARLGDVVGPGDLVGFIRIGALVTPVTFDPPDDGCATLTEVLAEEGTIVGWGSALFRAVRR